MSLTELKIKRKTLAAESRFIRQEEIKFRDKAREYRNFQKKLKAERAVATWDSLYRHRKNIVRPEARAANIAHAFIKGIPYHCVENKVFLQNYMNETVGDPNRGHDKLWERVIDIVCKFTKSDNDMIRNDIIAWRNRHAAYWSQYYGQTTLELRNYPSRRPGAVDLPAS